MSNPKANFLRSVSGDSYAFVMELLSANDGEIPSSIYPVFLDTLETTNTKAVIPEKATNQVSSDKKLVAAKIESEVTDPDKKTEPAQESVVQDNVGGTIYYDFIIGGYNYSIQNKIVISETFDTIDISALRRSPVSSIPLSVTLFNRVPRKYSGTIVDFGVKKFLGLMENEFEPYTLVMSNRCLCLDLMSVRFYGYIMAYQISEDQASAEMGMVQAGITFVSIHRKDSTFLDGIQRSSIAEPVVEKELTADDVKDGWM